MSGEADWEYPRDHEKNLEIVGHQKQLCRQVVYPKQLSEQY